MYDNDLNRKKYLLLFYIIYLSCILNFLVMKMVKLRKNQINPKNN